MDLAAPPAGTEPSPPPGASPGGSPPDAGSPRIVGGVAALLGDRLGLDPLWVRIGFVLLALAGGIGLMVYAGLWLVLLAGRTSGWVAPRYLGAIVLLGILPLTLNGGSFDLMTGPFAIVLLLSGLALALWSPRAGATTSQVPTTYGRPVVRVEPLTGQVPEPQPRRAPSILGRATLGVAIVVAAAGALIDEANGGRLHPEQWLGAAAVVCGLGLVVGAVRGHARWLVVPAAVFAGAAFVGAPMARLGIGTGDLAGNQFVLIGDGTPGGTIREHVAIGDVDLDISDVPDGTVTLDARTAFGDVEVDAIETVTVEIRARVDEGSVRVDGVATASDVIRIGPGERPDVIVDARVGRGDVTIRQYERRAREIVRPDLPVLGPPLDIGPLTSVADGVAVTTDGWFVLADGATVIDATDQVVVGESFRTERGVFTLPTGYGEFRLLPRSLLITPFGEVLDLQAIRAQVVDQAPTTTVVPSIVPGTTTGG